MGGVSGFHRSQFLMWGEGTLAGGKPGSCFLPKAGLPVHRGLANSRGAGGEAAGGTSRPCRGGTNCPAPFPRPPDKIPKPEHRQELGTVQGERLGEDQAAPNYPVGWWEGRCCSEAEAEMSLEEGAALAAEAQRPMEPINLTECLSSGRTHSRTC